jgi:hypothetical protein
MAVRRQALKNKKDALQQSCITHQGERQDDITPSEHKGKSLYGCHSLSSGLYRRLRLLFTESAVKNGSRACGTKPHTAGGELHPALRTILR